MLKELTSTSGSDETPEASAKGGVSFVVPCLNEEQTLPLVLERLVALRDEILSDRAVEIIVSDNGSTDNSVAIASTYGARVLNCSKRGYGAALINGITQAENDIVVFADADNTYDFLEAPSLIRELERGYDLVLGSRLRGTIHQGAMPFLHRHVGTPVLSALINLLYARDGGKISDCNSGFRCFRKSSFLTWQVNSTGMEFASEMLVRAMQSGAKISEVPISLSPDKRGRVPHLKTWRDGMRHLLQILKESPAFFVAASLPVFVGSWLILIAGASWGPTQIGPVRVFGVHSMIVALVGSLLALAIWGAGLMIVARSGILSKIYTPIISIGEERLFWGLVASGLLCLSFFFRIVLAWEESEFSFLARQQELLLIAASASNIIFISMQIFTAHLIKRAT